RVRLVIDVDAVHAVAGDGLRLVDVEVHEAELQVLHERVVRDVLHPPRAETRPGVGMVVVLEVDALDREVLRGDPEDPRLLAGSARGDPAAAAAGAVLASIPEEQAVGDLVVLVAAAELEAVEAEVREEVARSPVEVAALERVRARGAVV